MRYLTLEQEPRAGRSAYGVRRIKRDRRPRRVGDPAALPPDSMSLSVIGAAPGSRAPTRPFIACSRRRTLPHESGRVQTSVGGPGGGMPRRSELAFRVVHGAVDELTAAVESLRWPPVTAAAPGSPIRKSGMPFAVFPGAHAPRRCPSRLASRAHRRGGQMPAVWRPGGEFPAAGRKPAALSPVGRLA
jgi:hypothetical protein